MTVQRQAESKVVLVHHEALPEVVKPGGVAGRGAENERAGLQNGEGLGLEVGRGGEGEGELKEGIPGSRLLGRLPLARRTRRLRRAQGVQGPAGKSQCRV